MDPMAGFADVTSQPAGRVSQECLSKVRQTSDTDEGEELLAGVAEVLA